MECSRCSQPIEGDDPAVYCDDCMTERWDSRFTAGLLAGLGYALYVDETWQDCVHDEYLKGAIAEVERTGKLPEEAK
jgi:hypothetical protein